MSARLHALVPGVTAGGSDTLLSGPFLTPDMVTVGGHPLPNGTPITGAGGSPLIVGGGKNQRTLRVEHVPDPTRPDAERVRELATTMADAVEAN